MQQLGFNFPLHPAPSNAPNTFANLLIWHDSDNSTIAVRTDRANSFDALQADPTKQPVLLPQTARGHDALRFDAVNDSMVVPGSTIIEDAIDDQLTYEFVWRGSPPTFKTVFEDGELGIRWRRLSMFLGSTSLRVAIVTTVGSITVTVPNVFDGDIHHYIWRLNNGTSDFFKDGVNISSFSYDVGTGGLGTDFPLISHLGDGLDDFMFALYSDAKSDDDIELKWQHASKWWGIPVGLQADKLLTETGDVLLTEAAFAFLLET